MALICPTITETTLEAYAERIEKLQSYATRIHPDLTDGDFAPNKTIPLADMYWGELIADLHVMYRTPADHLETVIALKPHMMVFHSEADGDLSKLIDDLHKAGIKAGVALLQETQPEDIEELLKKADHALVFSGNLGFHGGTVDFGQTKKIDRIKAINPAIEIGWDGGVSTENAKELMDAGVDVLNTGGFIAHAEDEQVAYQSLVSLLA